MDSERKLGAILVVDDDDSVRTGVARALQEEGYEVATAANGHDALELAARSVYDLVFLDIRMPGMDGFNVLSLMTARNPGTPIVMLTAVTDPGAESEAIDREAFSYLTKPCRLSDITDIANRLLRSKSEQGGRPDDVPRKKRGVPDASEVLVQDGDEMELELFGRGSVIIVDDDERIRDNVARLLRDEGYFVATAVDGRDALAKVSLRHFDLMFLDIKMPGISGLGVLARMATEYPETVVVVLTALSGDFTREVAGRNEAFAYLTKPCRLEQILAMAHEILQRPD